MDADGDIDVGVSNDVYADIDVHGFSDRFWHRYFFEFCSFSTLSLNDFLLTS